MSPTSTSSGSRGAESKAQRLQNELTATKTKLETLLQEKQQAEENVQKVQTVLESERAQLREVLKQAKMKIDMLESHKERAEKALEKERAKVVELEEEIRLLKLRLQKQFDELTVYTRQLEASKGETADAVRECSRLEVLLKSKEQEYHAIVQRHESELATENARYINLQEACTQGEREREGLSQTLANLREKLDLQQKELAAQHDRYRERSNELDLVSVDRDKKGTVIQELQLEVEALRREVSVVGDELRDSIAEQEKRGVTISSLQDELEALKRRAAADLENERNRFNALQSRGSKSDEERAALEAKLAELRRALQQMSEQLEAEKRTSSSLRSEIDVVTRERNARDTKIDKLQNELAELRARLQAAQEEIDHAIASRNEFEMAEARARDENKQLSITLTTTRRRAAVHLAYMVLQRTRALHYACSFYFWAQIASDGALRRGAEELSQITAQAGTKSTQAKQMEDWNIEAMDIKSFASSNFGL